jgi:hypothetical protein
MEQYIGHTYRLVPDNKSIDALKFSLSLAQGLMEKYSPGVPRFEHGRPSTELPPKRFTE